MGIARINTRLIAKVLGMTLMVETIFMLLPALVSYYYEEAVLYPFLYSNLILLVSGLILFLYGRRAKDTFGGKKEGFLTVTLIWMSLPLFGMLPYLFGGYIDNLTDAYFEAMSGFSTTGLSVLNDIEILPNGMLFWRSLMQWQGGLGIIVFTVSVLPIMGGGASSLYDAETTGYMKDRFLPRVKKAAGYLFQLYLLLTVAAILLLWAGPMDFFDALSHGLSTISTGGYSTKNAGVGYWQSAYTEYIMIIIMCIGATNFPLMYMLLRGDVKKIRKEELRWFYLYILAACVVLCAWMFYNNYESGVEETIRHAAFQVVSFATCTGYSTADHIVWGPFFGVLALVLMLTGGCTASTSGGIKVGRIVILVKNLLNEFKKQIHPHAILTVKINGKSLPNDVVNRVLAFIFAYLSLIVLSSLVLTFDGSTLEEAIGASVSSISNVGSGLGSFGPGSTYAELSVFSKWYLAFLMMVGRLEIFTVLAIFLPSFWKQ